MFAVFCGCRAPAPFHIHIRNQQEKCLRSISVACAPSGIGRRRTWRTTADWIAPSLPTSNDNPATFPLIIWKSWQLR